jgi:hypothetical protein
MRILLTILLVMFLFGCGPKETEAQRAYKEEVYQEDKAEMQEYDSLTENPNAIYFP